MKTTKKEKGSWGGAREKAGRKEGEKRVDITINVPISLKEALHKAGYEKKLAKPTKEFWKSLLNKPL